ncbi:MAG: hypothetical protein LBU32_14180 [Clostridiales bacterium]|nr:hypothetical protein [Clostridiales bacterium]
MTLKNESKARYADLQPYAPDLEQPLLILLELDFTASAIDIGISYLSMDSQAPKKEH